MNDTEKLKELMEMNRVLRRIVAATVFENKGCVLIDVRTVKLITGNEVISIGTTTDGQSVKIQVEDL